MSVLSALFKLFKKVLSTIIKFVVKIVKKIWPILLVVGVAWLAPAIAPVLTSLGMPGWLVSGFTTMSSGLVSGVTSAVEWVASGATSVASSAWTAFKGAELGTQVAVASGALALLAPDETVALVEEVTQTAGDVLGGTLSAVGSALFSSPWVLGAAALGLYFLLKRDETAVIVPFDNSTERGDDYA